MTSPDGRYYCAQIVRPASSFACCCCLVDFGQGTGSGAICNGAISVGRLAFGATIGVGLSLVLALAGGLLQANDIIVDPVLQMLRTLPYLGVTPVLLLWFAIGEAPKIALVAFASKSPVYLTLLGGIRAVDPKLLGCARLFGLSRCETIPDVIATGSGARTLNSASHEQGQ